MRDLVPVLAALALAACSNARPPQAATPAPGAASPTAGTSQPAAQRVDGATARRLVETGATLIDVRTREEYESGHVPGALLVPYDQIRGRAAEAGPPDRAVVVYCRSGRRSAIAAETLRGLGFAKVYDLGPMDTWNALPAPPPPRSSQ